MAARITRRFSCAPHLASLSLLAALAGTASAASLVQVDLTGTASGFAFPVGPFTGPFTGSFSYDPDPAANPGAAGHFILAASDFLNVGSTPDSSDLFVENDVTSGTATVDRLTVTAASSWFLGNDNIAVTLEFSPDFLPAVQLPTLADFQAALAAGKLLGASASEGESIILAPFPLGYTATIGTVTARPAVSAVPTPAAALGALPLLGLVAFRRRPAR